MSNNKKIHTFGDNNTILSDITARDINIITGKEDNSEITEKKSEIATKIVDALQRLATVKDNEHPTTSENKYSKDDFDDIAWEDLLEAIELGNCILFIGQDIAINDDNQSIHEAFFKRIGRRKIEYDEKDGFFLPKAERQIETKALNYYSKKFNDENSRAYLILEKLAQLPFSLIIPVCPDETMHKIYNQLNKQHCFKFYKPEEKQEIREPTLINPVIYNLLGNAASDGKYIYTHEQYYKYINEPQDVKIPLEIENKIKGVPFYLFIGIDFNRWYNRLLLFTLNLDEGSEAYTFTPNGINEFHQNFIDKQFNIVNIENDYQNFVTVLIKECEHAGISKSLESLFIENSKNEILRIKDKARAADSFIELSNIIEEINLMTRKIKEFIDN